MPRRLFDHGFRLAYRLGFRLLLLWWFLRRPDHAGALVAVWQGGRILMLKHSYRRALHFPGGGLGRGEAPRAGAARELAEETGITVAPDALRLAREMTAICDWRRDHVSIFELQLAAPPALRIDRREIVAAEFMTPAAVLAEEASPFVRAYLAERRVA